MAAPLTRAQRAGLQRLHESFDRENPKLHCVYVRELTAEVDSKHLNWAHRKLLRRPPFSGIGRGELPAGRPDTRRRRRRGCRRVHVACRPGGYAAGMRWAQAGARGPGHGRRPR